MKSEVMVPTLESLGKCKILDADTNKHARFLFHGKGFVYNRNNGRVALSESYPLVYGLGSVESSGIIRATEGGWCADKYKAVASTRSFKNGRRCALL